MSATRTHPYSRDDTGARDRSDKSPLDVAVVNANTDIADYLRDMLPDTHLEQQHSCKERGGFERAGRWMRLSRATGYLQDLVSYLYHRLQLRRVGGFFRRDGHRVCVWSAASREKRIIRNNVPGTPLLGTVLVDHTRSQHLGLVCTSKHRAWWCSVAYLAHPDIYRRFWRRILLFSVFSAHPGNKYLTPEVQLQPVL